MQRCDVHFGGHCDPRAEDLTDFFCKREWQHYLVIEFRTCDSDSVLNSWAPRTCQQEGRVTQGLTPPSQLWLSWGHQSQQLLTKLHPSQPIPDSATLCPWCAGLCVWMGDGGRVCVCECASQTKIPSPATESVSWCQAHSMGGISFQPSLVNSLICPVWPRLEFTGSPGSIQKRLGKRFSSYLDILAKFCILVSD